MWWTIRLVTLTAIAELAVALNFDRIVDVIAAIPLLLFVPGAAVLRLFKRVGPIASSERILWIPLVSMGTSVLGGLLLNLLGGLTRLNWLLFVASVVVVFCIVDLAPKVPTDSSSASDAAQIDPSAPSQEIGRRLNSPIRTRTLVSIGVALLLLGCSLTLSIVSANVNRERFAQLWLVPSDKTATSVGPSAQLGVRNYEGHTAHFIVSVAHGRSSSSLKQWSLTLPNGATWSATVNRPDGVSLRATLSFDGRSTQFVALQAPR